MLLRAALDFLTVLIGLGYPPGYPGAPERKGVNDGVPLPHHEAQLVEESTRSFTGLLNFVSYFIGTIMAIAATLGGQCVVCDRERTSARIGDGATTADDRRSRVASSLHPIPLKSLPNLPIEHNRQLHIPVSTRLVSFSLLGQATPIQ